MNKNRKHILLTGQPKAGKSFLLEKLINSFSKNSNVKMKGMITSELKFKGIRIGIKIKNINTCAEEVMAVKIFKENKYNPKNTKRLASYQVDIEAIDRIALPIFKNLNVNYKSDCTNLVIIDEIGKMELFSKKFEKEIKRLFFKEKDKPFLILAIVPIVTDISLVEKLKNRSDVEVIELSKSNRDNVYRKIRNIVITYCCH